MSSNDYSIQNIYKYNRKSYKKNGRQTQPNDAEQDENVVIDSADCSPRSEDRDEPRVDFPSYTCEVDPDEIADILHKKCPVITLAQQQLRRLLEETDKIICDNTRCCRSIYDFVNICKEVLLTRNKCLFCMATLLCFAFLFGLLVGAASCGTYKGEFGSPILSCLDSYFTPDVSYRNLQEYQGIV